MSTNAYTGRAGSLGPLFESVEQAKHLERVSERIASYVLQFCARHETFTLQKLVAYVQRQSPGPPDSASRISFLGQQKSLTRQNFYVTFCERNDYSFSK